MCKIKINSEVLGIEVKMIIIFRKFDEISFEKKALLECTVSITT